MTATILYGLAGIGLFVLGFYGLIIYPILLRKILAVNIMGGGVFMVLVAIAYQGSDSRPDPVPHAMVLTGIVVAISATALALTLSERINKRGDD
jgi:multicomponent Na+:H+ antiporter subunit C